MTIPEARLAALYRRIDELEPRSASSHRHSRRQVRQPARSAESHRRAWLAYPGTSFDLQLPERVPEHVRDANTSDFTSTREMTDAA